MDDDALIDELQQKVYEAEELLRRRKDALAALKGKTVGSRKDRKPRGFRGKSIPSQVYAFLKATRQHASLQELAEHLKKADSTVDARKISLALSKYVRSGRFFVQTDEGKYGLK